jgi:hypothetical protein
MVLTDVHVELLRQLIELPENMRIKDPYNMPIGCKELEAAGYAAFLAAGNPQDLLVEITDKGRQALTAEELEGR